VSLLLLAPGVILVALILRDVFQSVVVPRWTSNDGRISPVLVTLLWRLWRRMGRMQPTERREDFLGTFAPLALVITLIAWAGLLIFGYGLILFALRDQIRPAPTDLGEACYLSGVSLFSIGYGDMVPVGVGARIAAVASSASGLAVVALVISLLFSLHSSFQRRETLVVRLEPRAGAPPSGLTLLETYKRLDLLPQLPALFSQWEEWCAEVLESHRAYPLLPYFRSSHTDESWISALGAVMDAGTLLTTTIDKGTQGDARVFEGLARHTVADLSTWCGLECGAEVGVTREEWEEACRRLDGAGYTLRPAETAWPAFCRARREYASALLALSDFYEMPLTELIGKGYVQPHPHLRMVQSGDERSEGMACEHVREIRTLEGRANGCEECMKMGDQWVHLRICLSCGHVGCCDSSKNKHATKHFNSTGHPMVRSKEPGEEWAWCYEDELFYPETPAPAAG
jgi:hypothetical protein